MDEILKLKLEQIERQMGQMNTKLDNINERTGKIEKYLYNDEDTGTEGIVKSVAKLDKRLSAMEDADKIKNAKMSVWGVIGGAVAMVAIEIAKYFFSSHK